MYRTPTFALRGANPCRVCRLEVRNQILVFGTVEQMLNGKIFGVDDRKFDNHLPEASSSRRRSFACSSAIHFSNCSTSLSSLEWSGLRELENRANTSLFFSICLDCNTHMQQKDSPSNFLFRGNYLDFANAPPENR